MPETLFPTTYTGFTEYIQVAYNKVQTNLSVYGIRPEKLATITPLYTAYLQAEAVAANPDTATTGARRSRNNTLKTLKSEWRKFLNENIRYNSSVPVADLEVFHIKKRDTKRTRAGVPDNTPMLAIKQVGVRRLEVVVINSETGKKKKPQFAAGSYLYLAITNVGQTPQLANEYHKQGFSSNCHHVLEFPQDQLAKQAHIFARYSNAHGKEGPEGLTETVIIS